MGSKSLWVAPLEAFYVLYIFAKSVVSTFPLQSTTETMSFQTKKGPKIAQIFLNITDLTNYTIKHEEIAHPKLKILQSVSNIPR